MPFHKHLLPSYHIFFQILSIENKRYGIQPVPQEVHVYWSDWRMDLSLIMVQIAKCHWSGSEWGLQVEEEGPLSPSERVQRYCP